MNIVKIVAFGVIAFILLCSTARAETLVIVNNSVTQASISKKEIKRIFLGKKKKWTDGKRIRPAILKGGAVHEEFLGVYVEKTASSFSSFWKREVVAGIGIPPKGFRTETDIVRHVSQKEGAIGYISPGTPHVGTKVLSID